MKNYGCTTLCDFICADDKIGKKQSKEWVPVCNIMSTECIL